MDRCATGTTWGRRTIGMLPGFSNSGALPVEAGAEAVHCDGGRLAAEPRQAPGTADERLARCFREHFDTLWRFAARLGVPRQHIDDVVQEVFITASRRMSDIAAGAERRFLISATLRISANQRRRSARQLDRPGLVEQQADGARSSAEQLDQKRLIELLYAALDQLSCEQRTVFVLHELEGFTVPQIAELLGVPGGTAASRLGRARAAFATSAARLRTLWLEGDAG